MSFSTQVKKELCKIKPDASCCMNAEVYGLLLFAKSFHQDSIFITAENHWLLEMISEFLAISTGTVTQIEIRLSLSERKNSVASVIIPDKGDRIKVLSLFGHDPEKIPMIQLQNFKEEECLASFFRGAFLVCGLISDPNKEYRLEFVISKKALAEEFSSLLASIALFTLHPKITKRNTAFVVYLKESEQIADFLVYIGAKNAAMELMQVKMVKEVRNYINRTTNFQTANLSKTAVAAADQMSDILFIKQTKGLEFLPKELSELAKLRLKHPELSLKELSQSLEKPISRSGVNHRLKKIKEIAAELRSAVGER